MCGLTVLSYTETSDNLSGEVNTIWSVCWYHLYSRLYSLQIIRLFSEWRILAARAAVVCIYQWGSECATTSLPIQGPFGSREEALGDPIGPGLSMENPQVKVRQYKAIKYVCFFLHAVSISTKIITQYRCKEMNECKMACYQFRRTSMFTSVSDVYDLKCFLYTSPSNRNSGSSLEAIHGFIR